MILSMLLAAQVPVGQFRAEGPPPSPWRVVRIDKKTPPTRYRVARIDGVTAIEGVADKSMALLARPVTVDLDATPVLCWRWRVDAPVAAADMRRKSGDDYAARVYVAFDIPNASLTAGTRFKLGIARKLFGAAVPDAAINYVWDNSNPVGTRMKSAYTDRADVAADFARAFGNVPGKPTQIAVAVDTDNTRSLARGAFADLHFVARDKPCAF